MLIVLLRVVEDCCLLMCLVFVQEASFNMHTVTAALVAACILPIVLVASLPLWERDLGQVGFGSTVGLMSTDGETLYTLWSCNGWSNLPSYFLLALDTNTGAMKWNGTLFGPFTIGMYCYMTQDASNVYVTATYSGVIVALSKASGAQLWMMKPYQGSTTYGVASLSPELIVTANDYSELLINASTGAAINVNQPNSMGGVTPFCVTLDTAKLVFMNTKCYELQANMSLTPLWQFSSTTIRPQFLTASPQIAVVADQSGVGVPRLSAVSTLSGSPIWSISTYNSQATYQWASVVNGEDITVLCGSVLQYYNATGGLVWEQGFANLTGNPILDPTAQYAGVPVAAGAGFGVAVVHLASGVVTETVMIVEKYDQYYQQAQPYFGAAVVGASISSNQQTANQQIRKLVVQSLTPKPPVGVVVRNYASADCSGSYVAEVLPTGCVVDQANEATSRTCSGSSSVVVASGTSCAAVGAAETFAIGACNGGISSSFRIVSCS
jgi:hypothetical protein